MSAQDPAKSQLLIVDDHPLFREGLRQMIERDPLLAVCGEAANGTQALELIPQLKPDLVLVDISLGSGSGIDLVKSIRGFWEDLPILVISMHDESLYAERALRAGAMGYVMKHESGKVVRTAIHKALQGEVTLSDRMSSNLIARLMRGGTQKPDSPLEILSDRELEVFRLLGQGKGTRQIAADLSVTIPTVHSFRNRIKEKLQLKSSTEVMLQAIQWSGTQMAREAGSTDGKS
jgi:DNA-binding NarL/FixJ family response regulator